MRPESNIYLICGSGGVGKTTISAALGLKFAQHGYKTIVLTIDPAKRLATSLGISGLTDTPKKIQLPDDLKGSRKDGKGGEGEMWAMMLDTKKTFDRIVEKYAPSKEAARTILDNRIYLHMSQMLAGTQEYMAMGKMYEVHQQHLYDVIIFDTPPMRNALEFLAAPRKMMDMIRDSMLQILLKPALFLGKSGLKILERGSRQIIKVLDRIAGFAFIQELSEMFILFKDLLGGFQARAEKVHSLLSDPSCGFMAVCTTDENSVLETQSFQKQLNQFHYHLDKIIVNRVHRDYADAGSSGVGSVSGNVESHRHRLKKFFTEKETDQLLDNYMRFIPLIRRDREILDKLSLLAGRNNIVTIPLFLSDVHDLEGLSKVSNELSIMP